MEAKKHANKPMNQHGLPEMFRPLLWSYRFEDIDPAQQEREIIINAINYGDLKHWHWLVSHYGLPKVRAVLTSVPATEIRNHVRRLVCLLFGISEHDLRYAPRGPH